MKKIRLDRDAQIFLSALLVGSLFTAFAACQPQTECTAPVLAGRNILTISGNNFRNPGAAEQTNLIHSVAGTPGLKGQDVLLIYDQNSKDLVGPPDVVGVGILRAQGDGSFADAELYTDIQITVPGSAATESLNATPTIGYDIAVGDLNGDGIDDIVLAVSNERHGNGLVVIWGTVSGGMPSTRGAANGTLTGKFIPLKAAPVSLAIGDLDQDGRPDVAVVMAGTPGSVQVLLNTADGVKALDSNPLLGAIQDPGKSPMDSALPTQRGIIVKKPGGGSTTLVVASGDGSGDGGVETFKASVLGGLVPGGSILSSALAAYTIILEADTDGDGVPELVALDRTAGVVTVLGVDAATGKRSVVKRISVGTDDPVNGILVADMDGDGQPDFLLAHELTHVLQQKGSPKAELRLYSGSELPATGVIGEVVNGKPAVIKSFDQKLGSFAKGVAKVGLGVASSSIKVEYPIIIHPDPQAGKATGYRMISPGEYCGDSEHL